MILHTLEGGAQPADKRTGGRAAGRGHGPADGRKRTGGALRTRDGGRPHGRATGERIPDPKVRLAPHLGRYANIRSTTSLYAPLKMCMMCEGLHIQPLRPQSACPGEITGGGGGRTDPKPKNKQIIVSAFVSSRNSFIGELEPASRTGLGTGVPPKTVVQDQQPSRCLLKLTGRRLFGSLRRVQDPTRQGLHVCTHMLFDSCTYRRPFHALPNCLSPHIDVSVRTPLNPSC